MSDNLLTPRSSDEVGPNSGNGHPPLLHRAISLQGIIQKSETGEYYLTLPDNIL